MAACRTPPPATKFGAPEMGRTGNRRRAMRHGHHVSGPPRSALPEKCGSWGVCKTTTTAPRVIEKTMSGVRPTETTGSWCSNTRPGHRARSTRPLFFRITCGFWAGEIMSPTMRLLPTSGDPRTEFIGRRFAPRPRGTRDYGFPLSRFGIAFGSWAVGPNNPFAIGMMSGCPATA